MVTVSDDPTGAVGKKDVPMSEITTRARYEILVAEDDAVNLDIIRAFLDGVPDLELTFAADGRMALERAMLTKFDLMIFDQNMPHITGDRVIRHLRSGRTCNSTTPVIRFTAEADIKPIEIKTVGGVAEAILPKPLRRETFVATIRAMLDAG